MKKRKCVKCGASLTDEDVMKIEFDDGSWEIVPLHVCPDCFAKASSLASARVGIRLRAQDAQKGW